MRYSTEHRDQIYQRVHGSLVFAKNMGNRYEEKLLDTAKN